MSTQSGIQVSPELEETFKNAVTLTTVRAIKVSIQAERLVPSGSVDVQSDVKSDFDLLDSILEPADQPAYILYRGETGTEDWILLSYVPDHAKVREKMLYASTRATLTRQLGDHRFVDSIFATSKADLTPSGYAAHLRHKSSAAPLTDREKELKDIKQAEGVETFGFRGRSHIADAISGNGGGAAGSAGSGSAGVGLKWTEEAEEAVKVLGTDEATSANTVLLNIDSSESVALITSSSDLSLPSDSPAYAFHALHHEFEGAPTRSIVFVYCCPPKSPIKSRLVYSSSAQSIVAHARILGVNIAKKFETSDPSEITPGYILSEVQPPPSSSSAPSAGIGSSNGAGQAVEGQKANFSRPRPPGRKR